MRGISSDYQSVWLYSLDRECQSEKAVLGGCLHCLLHTTCVTTNFGAKVQVDSHGLLTAEGARGCADTVETPYS
jgi:hypothetical protein